MKIEPSASEQFWGDVADVAGEILTAFIGVDSAVEGAQEAQKLMKDGAERTDFAIDEAIEDASDRHRNHDENFNTNRYKDGVGSAFGGAINAGSGAADSAAQIAAAAAMGTGGRALSSANQATQASEKILNDGPKDTYVYLRYNTGATMASYVGITNNIQKRAWSHGLFDYQVQAPNTAPLTRMQARSIEQAIFVNNRHFSNILNPISPRKAWYNGAYSWGVARLQDNGYSNLLKE